MEVVSITSPVPIPTTHPYTTLLFNYSTVTLQYKAKILFKCGLCLFYRIHKVGFE